MAISSEKILSTLIRAFLFIGLVAVIFVVVQSCQMPKISTNDLDRFARGELSKLQFLPNPPAQPDLEFTTLDGETMRLSDLRGKVVLLNVWATWCPPCVKEMPMLDQLKNEHSDSAFDVVTVSIDRNPQEPAEFFDRNNIQHLKPWHDGTYSTSFKVSAPGLPVSIIYSPEGREIARISGEVDWVHPDVISFIDHLSDG